MVPMLPPNLVPNVKPHNQNKIEFMFENKSDRAVRIESIPSVIGETPEVFRITPGNLGYSKVFEGQGWKIVDNQLGFLIDYFETVPSQDKVRLRIRYKRHYKCWELDD